MTISKSDYMLFLKHPAWAWLKKFDKSKLPPTSETLQAIFDDGHLFETYAEKLFPGAVRLGWDKKDYGSYNSLPGRTKEEIDKGTEVILQGRLEFEDLTCIPDILEKTDDGYNLYEIKSSTEIKEEYLYDLSFQLQVLEGNGLKVEKVFVINVNNEYVRNGEIDPKSLCKVTDVTDKVREKKDETGVNIERLRRILNVPTPPDMSPRHARDLKDWMEVYKFIHGEFDKYSIYDLCRLRPELIGELEDLNISLISDIPDGIKLSMFQERQVKATKLGKQILDLERIKDYLKTITYPIYFLDYETMSGMIPSFDGTKPYQQIPFQYSLHIIEKPGGELKHKEYLHTENTNPGLSLVEKLKEDIGDDGTVLVWYESFEKGRNSELGEMFPEYEDFMNSVNDRVVDLMLPFSSGWYIDRDFLGSASIKHVLPTLIKELSYKDLGIQDGLSAQRKWMKAVLKDESPEEKEKILADLIEYCKMDTLAMVKIYQHLASLG